MDQDSCTVVIANYALNWMYAYFSFHLWLLNKIYVILMILISNISNTPPKKNMEMDGLLRFIFQKYIVYGYPFKPMEVISVK